MILRVVVHQNFILKNCSFGIVTGPDNGSEKLYPSVPLFSVGTCQRYSSLVQCGNLPDVVTYSSLVKYGNLPDIQFSCKVWEPARRTVTLSSMGTW